MRLLWIQPGAIGDFIVSMPAMAWAKQKLTPAWFEVWAERVNVPLAQAPGYADQALAFAEAGIGRYPVPEGFYERLLAFDLVLCWGGTGAAAVTHRHPNSHFMRSFPSGATSHVLDFKKSQLERFLDSDITDFPLHPEIRWTPADLEFAREFLNGDRSQAIAVIHPGASGERKQWPAANFARLAVRLAERKRMKIFLNEGPRDTSLCDGVANLVAASNAPVELRRVRLSNLRQLSAVLSLCALFVGNDSGITHLAAASGISTLAIFTVTDPKVWAPRGPEVRVCVNPTVDEVWLRLSQPPEPVVPAV